MRLTVLTSLSLSRSRRIKRKAEDEGRDVDDEELDLCGISEQMSTVGGKDERALEDGVDGVLEEGDIVFSKRQRRGSK